MALGSISTNILLQQQALQSQLAATQSAASTAAPTDTTTAPAASTATANPAAALTSGNAALTSDLLSVLLNEQSGASSGSGGTTLAGILDQQDIADEGGIDGAAQQQNDTQPSLLGDIDAASAAQSATSTDSVLSGLQDLLAQLAV